MVLERTVNRTIKKSSYSISNDSIVSVESYRLESSLIDATLARLFAYSPFFSSTLPRGFEYSIIGGPKFLFAERSAIVSQHSLL